MAQTPTHGPDGSEILSVGDFTRRIKTAVEGGVPRCWVRGEVSNLTHHNNGHVYFSLKDMRAQVGCVLFRQDALRLRAPLRAGQEIVALGDVSVYEPQGRYQLVCRVVVDVGEGELQRRYEALKAKLDAEGLFAQTRKRPLPQWPGVIYAVTSPTGAAIADFVSILGRRGYRGRVVLIPSRVQGEGAAAEIVAGIRLAAQLSGECGGGPFKAERLSNKSGSGQYKKDGVADEHGGGQPENESLFNECGCGTRGENGLLADNSCGEGTPSGGNGRNAAARATPRSPAAFCRRQDLLVVMRGGGSLEDLWPFNEEAVARALAASPLPSVSAIGHQIDFSLSDFVADLRAETPSGAAELIATGFRALLDRCEGAAYQLEREAAQHLRAAALRFSHAAQGVRGVYPQRMLEQRLQRLDELQARLGHCAEILLGRRRMALAGAVQGIQPAVAQARLRSLGEQLHHAGGRLRRASGAQLMLRRQRLQELAARLAGLSLHGTLARGYALVRDKEGRVVSRKAGLEPGQLLALDFADGEIVVRIERV